MRIHLHDCPGDPGAAEHSIDWAPLERLLSQGPVSYSLVERYAILRSIEGLRPLLFRLLRDKTNQTKAPESRFEV